MFFFRDHRFVLEYTVEYVSDICFPSLRIFHHMGARVKYEVIEIMLLCYICNL